MAPPRRKRNVYGSGGRAPVTSAVKQRAAAKPPKTPSANRPKAQRPPVAAQPAPAAAGMNTQMGQQAAAPYSGGTGGYNISADPAVMAAQGLAQKMRATAQASALAKRKQAAIEYGDPSGVEGIDAGTAKAATDNPFSVLKNLEHSYKTGTRDLEEGLNSANLFYSGYRGQQLGEAARGQQNALYQAGTGFKGLMTDINDQLAQALMGADAMEASSIMGSDGGSYGGGGDAPPSYGVPYNPGVAIRPPGFSLSGAGRIQGTSAKAKPKPMGLPPKKASPVKFGYQIPSRRGF